MKAGAAPTAGLVVPAVEAGRLASEAVAGVMAMTASGLALSPCLR